MMRGKGKQRTSPDDETVTSIISVIPRLGIWAWSFVGLVIAAAVVVLALAAVSEIALPMTFAVVLAILFKPLATKLVKRRFKPTLAAGLVVIGLLLLVVGIVTATVRGVVDQVDEIGSSASAAIENTAEQTDAAGVDQATLESIRAAVEEAEPMITTGILSGLVSGIGALVAVASGIILGSLIMYYLLKDGTRLRQSLVDQVHPRDRPEFDDFIGDTCRILRDYGRGRTVLSAIVSVVIGLSALILGLPLVFTIMVVNFIGGYVPYIGAFLGGGLAIIVALGEGGPTHAVIMLAIVLVSNLVLENFVEPNVMGSTLDVHPVVVLIVTALGGLLGGIVGLILAVPAYMIGRDAINRLRSGGVVDRVAGQVRPTVRRMLK